MSKQDTSFARYRAPKSDMGPLTGKYKDVVLLLWIQLAVYPCSFAKSTQNTNTICPPNFQPLVVKSLSNCSIKLSNDSNNFEYALRDRISWEDGTIQRINTDMKIPKDYKTNEYHKMILPNKWLLAYIDPDGPFNFVSWSSDFKVLSLGLLSDENNEPITVNINETAGICDVEIGGNYMITEIVKLFTDFIREKVELDRHYDYENIHLCYLSKFEWFKKSLWYEAKQLFGIPFQEFGYKCCMVREETVCCDDKLHRIEGYRLLPYIISIFLVLFSPIVILYIADSAKEEGNNKQNQPTLQRVSVFRKIPFFLRFWDDNDIDRNQKIINDKDSAYYNYLQKSCCALPSSSNFCSSSCCCQFFFKRFKRLIFLLLFPSMIYFEFILLKSDVEWTELLKSIGEDDLLFGFPTMLGSLKNKKFLPPEGPMLALVFYHISGFFVIFLAKDFENSVLGRCINLPLTNTVNMLASKGFENKPERGYYNIGQILKAGMYLPFNAVYWITGKGCMMKLCRLILLPFFAIPIIPFSGIAFFGWVGFSNNKLETMKSKCKQWEEHRNAQVQQNRNRSCCSDFFKIFKLIALFFSILIFLIFYGLSVVILSYSIYLLLYIAFFTSLAFVISPSRKSKILIFIISAIVFEYQIIRDSIHFYTKLFHLIVEICESDDSLKENYIYDQGQSIDEKLVIAVFRQIRPAFVQTVNIIMKTVIVMLIYASALTFMLKFNDKMSDAIERLTILITSATPIILQWKYKTVCPTRKRVEFIIREYPQKAEQKAKKATEIAEKAVKKAELHTTAASQHATAALQHADEAKRHAKEAIQNAEKSQEAKENAKRTEQHDKNARQNVKEAEENAKKAKKNAEKAEEHATEAKRNAKQRNAKEAERNAKEAECYAKQAKQNAKEAERNAKEAERNAEEAKRNAEETARNFEKAEQNANKVKTEKADRNPGINEQTELLINSK